MMMNQPIFTEPDIAEIVNGLLQKAIRDSASDIHFIPGRKGGVVRFRIDGVLHDIESLNEQRYAVILSRIKIMAGLNVMERRMPQDGRIRTILDNHEYDIRITTAQAVLGETAALRILDRNLTVLDLKEYVPDEDVRSSFERWIEQPSGLVLSTGPTGSGKTTILYSLLKRLLANPAIKIVSIEDPVEFAFEGMVQLGVQPGAGLTFNSILRSVLRQDPDVIMLGEIRDYETLQTAVQAAITGHLVLTQMHTNNALEAVERMCDVGVPWWLLRDSLIGVSCQRLARLLCKKCREAYEPAKEDLADIPIPVDQPQDSFFRVKGCEDCHGTGYRGRMALFEQFEPDAAFWSSLAKRRGTELAILSMPPAGGKLLSFWSHAWRHIQNGDTSLAEVSRVLMNVDR